MDYTFSTVLAAVKSGNIEVLTAYLEEGKDYNIEDDDGWRLIHHAAYNGHCECVKVILDRAKSDGESVITTKDEKKVPTEASLGLATVEGHCDVVEFLTDLYSKSEVAYEDLGFPLHKACVHGQNKCINILATKMPQFVNALDNVNNRRYPIHITVGKGNIEGTKILIQNGCNINTKCIYDQSDGFDCTPLYLASKIGNIEMVRCLLDNGADTSKTSSYGGYDSLFLPIDTAADRGHIEIVEMLADCSPKDSKKPAVFHAALYGKNDCLMYLFEKGFPTFDSDAQLLDQSLWLRILHQCRYNVLPETVKILLENKTLFHSLAKLNEGRMCGLVKWIDIYFFTYTFYKVHPEVSKQFLDAGILELRFDCKSFPDVSQIIDKHRKLKNENGRYLKKDISRLLMCMEYLPFMTWSHKNSSVLPTIDNFGEGDLVENVPSLLNLARWTIRCLIIRNKGMIRREYVKSLKLPKKVTDFLIKC